ncbi:MAG: hypothetical protein PHR39_04705 [Actinomycetota bacterium]|nr:hypothetical protein [Actinomycetota bacterium]
MENESCIDHRAKIKKKDIPEFISLFAIKEAFVALKEVSLDDLFKNDYSDIVCNEQNKYKVFLKIFQYEFKNNVKLYYDAREKINLMVEKDKDFTDKQIKNNEGKYEKYQKKNIKEFLDKSLSVYQMAKYFLLEKNKKIIVEDYSERDSRFYDVLENVLNDCRFFDYYAEFRNFLTKKPFSENKIKLNFSNGQLMSGFDVNKEKDCDGILFRKNNKYYLGLLIDNKIFNKNVLKNIKINLEDNYYEKMFYKFLPDCKKMLPKVCFSRAFSVNYFVPDKSITSIYKKGLFKKDNQHFSLDALHKLIDFYKKALEKYEGWQMYSFSYIRDTKEYKNIGEFFKDVEKSSYTVWFEKIPEEYINQNVKDGKMYLFEIYNKDFSDKTKGNKNLHTLY